MLNMTQLYFLIPATPPPVKRPPLLNTPSPALPLWSWFQVSLYRLLDMRIPTEDNVPGRFELFLLGDGEKKVTEVADTRMPLDATCSVS